MNRVLASGTILCLVLLYFAGITTGEENSPVVIKELPDIILQEDEKRDRAIDLWDYVIDNESSPCELHYYIYDKTTYKCEVNVDSNRHISIEPWAHWSGALMVTIEVSDGLQSTFGTFNITVIPVNNPPVLNESSVPYDIRFFEDVELNNIDITSWFIDYDGDELSYDCSGFEKIDVILNPDGIARMIPESDWSGKEMIIFTASDETDNVEAWIWIEVLPANDPPTGVSISKRVWDSMYDFSLYGFSKDPDIVYGDEITYTWSSNLSNFRATGARLDKKDMLEGLQIITLTATDKSGESNSTSVEIGVYFENDETEAETTSGDKWSESDIDMDTLPDNWEIYYFDHLAYGPEDDFDKDGFSNYEEFLNWTNPKFSNKHPEPVKGIPVKEGEEVKNSSSLNGSATQWEKIKENRGLCIAISFFVFLNIAAIIPSVLFIIRRQKVFHKKTESPSKSAKFVTMVERNGVFCPVNEGESNDQ
jgi:hypothetical protein